LVESMVEPVEKSTKAIQEVIWQNERGSVVLDARLALYGEADRWLAVSDLHYGYEVRRRAKGGLWPMWGRETIKTRLDELLAYYQPECLILNGDIIDGASAGGREVTDWLSGVRDCCTQLILVEGNHDRGPLLREFPFRSHFHIGEFVFHHGHLPLDTELPYEIEVIGHVHPTVRFSDGAGLAMKLPCLVQDDKHWILPAFSPWAGGVRHTGSKTSKRWACSPKRIICDR